MTTSKTILLACLVTTLFAGNAQLFQHYFHHFETIVTAFSNGIGPAMKSPKHNQASINQMAQSFTEFKSHAQLAYELRAKLFDFLSNPDFESYCNDADAI